MTIPDFQSVMLPLLQLAGDKSEHSVRDAYDHISKAFGLNEEERRAPIASGQQPIIENRVGWARTYMTKAGLLQSTRRGYFQIGELGLQVLAQNPPRIDSAFLRQYPAFVEFQQIKKGAVAGVEQQLGEPAIDDSRTPQELLEFGYLRLRNDLANELLDAIKQSPPAFFERLVVELLLRMGYGGSRKDAGKAIGRSGDGGIDGIIQEDKLGLDAIYVQAKRWQGSVGSREIRDFVGSLVGHNANKGVFITTSSFTREAVDYTSTIQHHVKLVDGEQLAQFMIDHGVGVHTVDTYEVKRIDTDYFTET